MLLQQRPCLCPISFVLLIVGGEGVLSFSDLFSVRLAFPGISFSAAIRPGRKGKWEPGLLFHFPCTILGVVWDVETKSYCFVERKGRRGPCTI